jgi:hypothetical protein
MSDEPVMYNTSYDQPPPPVMGDDKLIIEVNVNDGTCTVRNPDGTTSVTPLLVKFAFEGCEEDRK